MLERVVRGAVYGAQGEGHQQGRQRGDLACTKLSHLRRGRRSVSIDNKEVTVILIVAAA
jgi:hypothetical protein